MITGHTTAAYNFWNNHFTMLFLFALYSSAIWNNLSNWWTIVQQAVVPTVWQTFQWATTGANPATWLLMLM